ncbi:MAG: glycoside hydrolase family 43 protein [Bacteroidales bacterium]|nr:glycoside hydrolase family 43 protein [Bacteroidales bacterium]
MFSLLAANAQDYSSFHPGEIWKDTDGVPINAHGGGVLFYNNTYYWFGEYKNEKNNSAEHGVTCYKSTDLYDWENKGIVLEVDPVGSGSEIEAGCIIERPKVIYNEKTRKFVMYFHLELKGKGYDAARVGLAISDHVTGPYKYIRSGRVNPGKWPANMTTKQRESKITSSDVEKWWTPEWYAAVNNGLFIRRDFPTGQMSRDMTLFVDEDAKTYHIYSSEENLTLHIAELTDDYMDYTGNYIRIDPAGHNEAPALFKHQGKYFLITSGCTGWDPNPARLLVADDIMGEWTRYPNPCIGENSETTFFSQSTYIIPVQDKKDAYIFMADRWRPKNPVDGRYVWLPVFFNEEGMPFLDYQEEWDLTVFD